MTRHSTMKAVNCTSCGAGLDILGGGRVTTHVCPYCGTVLDANDNYQAVKKFGDVNRPSSPFSIGTQGSLFGANYTVIGTLGVEERWRNRTWQWVEHQIYSETHGYAYLTVENGHVTFTHRIRDNVWMSSIAVETSENRPSVSYQGEKFSYYDTSDSVIYFAEGEFTWQPRKGQWTRTITAKCDTRMLEFSESSGEREIYLTSYVTPADVKAGFDITITPSAKVHPLMPIRKWKNGDFLIRAAGGLAVLSLFVGVALWGSSGQSLISSSFQVPQDLPISIPFEVTQPDGLVRIGIDSTVQNGWAYMNVEVTDPEDNVRFETGRTSEYYFGRDADGRWTEDSSYADIRFRPSTVGEHVLSIDLEEVGQWETSRDILLSPSQYRSVVSRIDLRVSQGLSSGFLSFVLAAILAGIAALPLARRYIAHRARWHGSDWTDD